MKLQTAWLGDGEKTKEMLKMKDDPDELMKTKGQKAQIPPTRLTLTK
jgi:hypothetical protein